MAVWASSTNAELPRPQGFGVFGQAEALGVGYRLTYLRYSDSTSKPGIVCQVYSPRIDCTTEGVDTSVRVGSARVEVLKLVPLGERIQLGVGGGASFNSLLVTATGESGRMADTGTPSSGNLGGLGTMSLALTPVASVPLTLRATGSLHWVRFNGCESPDDPTSGYAPFCGTDRFREIHVGLSYRVPRE